MTRRPHVILCNGAPEKSVPRRLRKDAQLLTLDYGAINPSNANVDIRLPDFVLSVNHLAPRVLDLLEVAAYVFCADRWMGRGGKDLVEYDAWMRTVHYAIRVRDAQFWQRPDVSQLLAEAVTWATGDAAHTFTFLAGHATRAAGLFDQAGAKLTMRPGARIALFSGGIDSLTGALQHLNDESRALCLVSHRSSSDVQNTQQNLVRALQERFPGRIQQYPFTCRLRGKRAEEETQRSRSFLFCSIAYALASGGDEDAFTVFENGVTSLNLPKREGMGFARASRTTHPKTIRLFERLLTLVHERPFQIETPFFWRTKADVLELLVEKDGADLFDSSVSCTRTFANVDQKTHCGGCSQCVDRRFAAAAAGLGVMTLNILPQNSPEIPQAAA